jgi:hypothetical protein
MIAVLIWHELNLFDNELAKIMPVSGHGFSDFVNNVHIPYWYKRIEKSRTDGVPVALLIMHTSRFRSRSRPFCFSIPA